MSKKAAFTMVELIFVIVILGILAAVAVPKLNASRADAKTAALKANLVTVAKDLETYYTANGRFCKPPQPGDSCSGEITDITSVPFDKLEYGGGWLYVNDKQCVYIDTGLAWWGGWAWHIRIARDDDCLKELAKPQYDDIKWIFEGYRDHDPSRQKFLDYGDAREKPWSWTRHWMNDPSKSVQFD